MNLRPKYTVYMEEVKQERSASIYWPFPSKFQRMGWMPHVNRVVSTWKTSVNPPSFASHLLRGRGHSSVSGQWITRRGDAELATQ